MVSIDLHAHLEELNEFKKKHVGTECWSSIVLKKGVCMALHTKNKFDDGIKDTILFIKQNHPNIYKMSFAEIKKHIPNIPKCQQFVIGTLEHQALYIMYNHHATKKGMYAPFIVSAAKDWTINLNKILITCGMNMYIGNYECDVPIRLLLPLKNKQLLSVEDNKPRITLLELCIVFEHILRFNCLEKLVNMSFKSTDISYDHLVVLCFKRKNEIVDEIFTQFDINKHVTGTDHARLARLSNTKKWIKRNATNKHH